MRRKLVTIALVLFGSGICSAATKDEGVPLFKATAQYETAISVLVPPTTTKAQLRNLIYRFRAARKEGRLSQAFPATFLAATPGGILDRPRGVEIFVFGDSKWSSQDMLEKFLRLAEHPSPWLSLKQRNGFLKQFINHTKAYYSDNTSEEEGSLGYEEDLVPGLGDYRSPGYKKLF